MIEVEISPTEIIIAAQLGVFRNIQSWKKAKDQHGADTLKDGWQSNIVGCIGEIGWAKYQKLYYNGAIGVYSAPDVLDGVEIRSSSIIYKHNARLRMHKDDQDQKKIILALVGMDVVLFPGWCWGYEGKQEKYWGDFWHTGRPAYWIPQADLRKFT